MDVGNIGVIFTTTVVELCATQRNGKRAWALMIYKLEFLGIGRTESGLFGNSENYSQRAGRNTLQRCFNV